MVRGYIRVYQEKFVGDDVTGLTNASASFCYMPEERYVKTLTIETNDGTYDCIVLKDGTAIPVVRERGDLMPPQLRAIAR
jgi:hypothetical protein